MGDKRARKVAARSMPYLAWEPLPTVVPQREAGSRSLSRLACCSLLADCLLGFFFPLRPSTCKHVSVRHSEQMRHVGPATTY